MSRIHNLNGLFPGGSFGRNTCEFGFDISLVNNRNSFYGGNSTKSGERFSQDGDAFVIDLALNFFRQKETDCHRRRTSGRSEVRGYFCVKILSV